MYCISFLLLFRCFQNNGHLTCRIYIFITQFSLEVSRAQKLEQSVLVSMIFFFFLSKEIKNLPTLERKWHVCRGRLAHQLRGCPPARSAGGSEAGRSPWCDAPLAPCEPRGAWLMVQAAVSVALHQSASIPSSLRLRHARAQRHGRDSLVKNCRLVCCMGAQDIIGRL